MAVDAAIIPWQDPHDGVEAPVELQRPADGVRVRAHPLPPKAVAHGRHCAALVRLRIQPA